MPPPIVCYYAATKHNGSIESDIELTNLEESSTHWTGSLEHGGERIFPKSEYKSVACVGFKPFVV